ncbi:hypothetical protein [Caballeronia sp. LZ034LL]|nr:hypothetical protein [Caballeronia sp. LZ034LL]MDR5837114.1 hypothetical protein [Caballeronia sp. LZ034LL]
MFEALEPSASRDYSIASLSTDGRIELLVRQAQHADAAGGNDISPGLASG